MQILSQWLTTLISFLVSAAKIAFTLIVVLGILIIRLLAHLRQPLTTVAVRLRPVCVRLPVGLLLVTLSVWLIFIGVREWKAGITQSNWCYRVPDDFWAHFRYIELTIDNEDLRRPFFDGRYFINLGKEVKEIPPLRIVQQENPALYGTTVYKPKFIIADDGEIHMQSKDDISLNSVQQRSHYMFPFDSARFAERFFFDPAIDIRGALLLNRVPGFYMPCDTVSVATVAGSATIEFELRRNPIIIYTGMLLLIVAASFAILITLFADRGPLPGALASYFFALWSVRALFGLTAENFPTLFDIGVVLLASLIPVLLLLRVLGLARALRPIRRCGTNFVRKLEGREPISSNTDV